MPSAQPHRAAVRVVATGVHTGELMGIAPTGKRFTLGLHELHALEGGRIARTWHMEDMAGLFHKLGQAPVIPPEG